MGRPPVCGGDTADPADLDRGPVPPDVLALPVLQPAADVEPALGLLHDQADQVPRQAAADPDQLHRLRRDRSAAGPDPLGLPARRGVPGDDPGQRLRQAAGVRGAPGRAGHRDEEEHRQARPVPLDPGQLQRHLQPRFQRGRRAAADLGQLPRAGPGGGLAAARVQPAHDADAVHRRPRRRRDRTVAVLSLLRLRLRPAAAGLGQAGEHQPAVVLQQLGRLDGAVLDRHHLAERSGPAAGLVGQAAAVGQYGPLRRPRECVPAIRLRGQRRHDRHAADGPGRIVLDLGPGRPALTDRPVGAVRRQLQLVFTSGPPSTDHSHLDALAVDLYSNGIDLLPDSGLDTYAAGTSFDFFHGTSAHNTVVVDGKDQGAGPVEAHLVTSGPNWEYASGTAALYPGVTQARSVLLLGHNLLLVVDSLSSTQPPHLPAALAHLPRRQPHDAGADRPRRQRDGRPGAADRAGPDREPR